MRRQDGYTLIEVLIVMSLLSVIVTLGASAFQRYGHRQSLEAGTDRIVGELRGLQQRVVSESNPLVYGARIVPDSGSLQLIRYNPTAAAGSRCSITETVALSGGLMSYPVTLRNPSFTAIEPTPTCTTELGAGSYVFFFARGTATAGSVEVFQPNMSASETITVGSLTSRVSRS